ncbi:MAG: glycosyltransferase family A protein [Lamprobacter sp.]|uniref:glycosyltransferase family 2 protein n=1 Tax=Lamprobacter sp. TaxID=3100796 RepID=UPI002B25D276|nr:glycosyltransferase family A protein [Lamprobacter sp.]MEA3639821.1 glycosyltransferase family A protein [Lamprobacter sp.]
MIKKEASIAHPPNKFAPLVSVIIPAFNRADVICDALESVAEQTYRPIEIVVVDDGSTDKTAEIVKKWFMEKGSVQDLQGICLIQENSGAPAARNKGFYQSQGEYLLFFDSDDLLKPNKIQAAIDAYQSNPNLDLVYSGWIVDNGRSTQVDLGPNLEDVPYVAEVVLRYLHTSAAVYKRSLLLQVGVWDESLTRSQDRELASRVATKVHQAKRVADFDVIYRLCYSTNSITEKKGREQALAGWRVNMIQRQRVRAQPSPLNSEALRFLARRNITEARRAWDSGDGCLVLRILFSQPEIWHPLLGRPRAAMRLFLGVLLSRCNTAGKARPA